jgi:hypothetical protein
MMVTAFLHARFRAPTIVLNLAKKLAIFHHSSAAAPVVIKGYKAAVTELLTEIRNVFG